MYSELTGGNKCVNGSTFNNKTKRCRKNCKPSLRRNPKTHHCRKVCKSNEKRNRKTLHCVPK